MKSKQPVKHILKIKKIWTARLVKFFPAPPTPPKTLCHDDIWKCVLFFSLYALQFFCWQYNYVHYENKEKTQL